MQLLGRPLRFLQQDLTSWLSQGGAGGQQLASSVQDTAGADTAAYCHQLLLGCDIPLATCVRPALPRRDPGQAGDIYDLGQRRVPCLHTDEPRMQAAQHPGHRPGRHSG